jgi:hypothetical protein
MKCHRSTPGVLHLALFALSLALVPMAASADASQPVVELSGFEGAIDVQPDSIDGHVTLESGMAALQASLADSGPDGQLKLLVPGHFVGSTTVGGGMLSYQLEVCGAGVTVALSGTRSVGLHLAFQDAADPARCTALPASPPAVVQAMVMGPVAPVAAQATPAPSETGSGQTWLADWLRRLVGYSLVGALLLLFIPAMPTVVATATQTSPWGRIGVGLALLFMMPLVGVLAFALLLPIGLWWLGLLVLALYPVLLILSLSVSGMALGSLALARLNQPRVPILVGLAAGTIILTAASLLPYVGPLVNVAAIMFGLGTLAIAPRTRSTAPLTPTTDEQTTPTDANGLVAAPVLAD